jgi:hypothetical protein
MGGFDGGSWELFMQSSNPIYYFGAIFGGYSVPTVAIPPGSKDISTLRDAMEGHAIDMMSTEGIVKSIRPHDDKEGGYILEAGSNNENPEIKGNFK